MEANSSYQINDAPFNLHLGRMVKEYIEKETSFTKTKIAEKMGLTRTCFSSRLSCPHYGNIHDLIKISIFLKKDFISPALDIVRNDGITTKRMYSEKEYNEMQINLALTEKKLYEKDRELNLTHELLEKYRMVGGQ
jgi:hypothetical protein